MTTPTDPYKAFHEQFSDAEYMAALAFRETDEAKIYDVFSKLSLSPEYKLRLLVPVNEAFFERHIDTILSYVSSDAFRHLPTFDLHQCHPITGNHLVPYEIAMQLALNDGERDPRSQMGKTSQYCRFEEVDLSLECNVIEGHENGIAIFREELINIIASSLTDRTSAEQFVDDYIRVLRNITQIAKDTVAAGKTPSTTGVIPHNSEKIAPESPLVVSEKRG